MKLTFFDRKNWSSPWIKSNNIDKKGENGGGTFHCFNFQSHLTHFLTWWIWVVCLALIAVVRIMITRLCKSFAQGLWGSLKQWSRAECVACLRFTIHWVSLSLQLGSSYYLLSMSFFVRQEKRKNNIFSFLSFITWQTAGCSVDGGGFEWRDIVNNVLSEFLWRPTL